MHNICDPGLFSPVVVYAPRVHMSGCIYVYYAQFILIASVAGKGSFNTFHALLPDEFHIIEHAKFQMCLFTRIVL